jgi:hypothetical protein
MFVWTDAVWPVSYLGKCHLLYISCPFISPFCSPLHIGCEKIACNEPNEPECRWLGGTVSSPFLQLVFVKKVPLSGAKRLL